MIEGIRVPPLDRRLQKRYIYLVKSHLHHAPSTAAGPTAALKSCSAFACTQAAWRFLNNDRVSLQTLQQPLIEHAAQRLTQCQEPYGLLVHDWCKLDYKRHTAKKDTATLTHAQDVGYELACALLLEAEHGQPVAPMQMHLRTAEGFLSTCPTLPPPPEKSLSHVNQVLPTMQASAGWGLDRPLVHVIDREGDSVGH